MQRQKANGDMAGTCHFDSKATNFCGTCQFCTLDECSFRRADPEGRHMRAFDLARGGRLCGGPDTVCMKFWIVIDGTAASCTTFADGRRQILGLEHPGSVVCGLMAGEGTQDWIEALTDCRICELDLSSRAEDLRHDADFLAASFRIAHARLARAQAHMTTLGRLDSRERVLLFLAEMAVQTGTIPATLPMSREDIADYLGLNAETVSRILTQFRKSGLVRFLSPTEYVLPDIEAIQRRLPVPVPEIPVPVLTAHNRLEKPA